MKKSLLSQSTAAPGRRRLHRRPHFHRHTPRCSAVLDKQQGASQQLLQSLQQAGLDPAKLPSRPVLTPRGHLSLVTSQRVARGSPLVSVPASCWITQQTVRDSPLGKLVGSLEPWLQLALLLIHEEGRPGSAVAAYVEAVRSQAEPPLVWSDAELEELAGTQVLTTLQSYRSYFGERYEQLQTSLFTPNPEAFPAARFCREAFFWAVATVRARTHAPLEKAAIALVPLADLAAHAWKGPALWKLKSEGVFGRGQSAVIEAERDYDAGEAVTMCYGPEKLDGQVFLDSGVVDAGYRRSGFVLYLALPEGDRFGDDKADILEQEGMASERQFTLLPDADMPEDMLAFLRLANLSGGDAFLLESLFRDQTWRFMQAPVSLVNEEQVYASMIAGCSEALSQYPTSIDADLAMLQDIEPGSKKASAVQVRLGEKEALDSVLRWFEGRRERLSELEYYQERRLKGLGLLDDDGRTTYDSFFKDSIA